MDFCNGLVPSDNTLSSLNLDSIDLSGIFPTQIPSRNSLFGNQMWSDPCTRLKESELNHNFLSYNNDIPFTSNSIPSTSSIGNEWDLMAHNSFLSSNLHGLENFNSADFPTCFLQEYQTYDDDILQLDNDDFLKSLVVDLPAISSQSSLTNLISGNGSSSDSPSYINALTEHLRIHTKEESFEDIFMAPLVDNKNVTVVPKKGLFSQLGLDQLLSNKVDSSSSAKCSDKVQIFSPKRQIMDCYTADAKSCITAQPEKAEESSKVSKKRAKPGERARPRPKDRQMIQDRIKELREIIPNGAKCSIDSLLERTIKHMVFMQGVMKYGDKLQQVDEFKAQRGNDNAGISSSAAWAIDVGGKNPIVVEDLGQSGQMLIEMLCEEQGFFLEIADVIKSFGLTILKGVVEARDDKIYAHFIVEANRDVTRMQVLMSLLQLLQDTSTGPLKMKTIGDKNKVVGNYNTTSSLLNNLPPPVHDVTSQLELV